MKKTLCLLLVLILCLSTFPLGCADEAALAFSDDPKAIQAASNSVVMMKTIFSPSD